MNRPGELQLDGDAGIIPRIGDDLQGLTDRFHRWHGWGDREVLVRRLNDEHWLAVVPMLFTWGLIMGRFDEPKFMTDRWCFGSFRSAVLAAAVWDGTGEPIGWIKHPNTGRYRPDGDPTREEIL